MYFERVLDLDAVDTHTQQGNHRKSIELKNRKERIPKKARLKKQNQMEIKLNDWKRNIKTKAVGVCIDIWTDRREYVRV